MNSVKKGLVIHIMGYHSSGKKDLCDKLVDKLFKLTNKNITYIDNEVKKLLSYGLNYNLEDRIKQMKRLNYISYEIAKNGGLIIFYSNYPHFKERESIKNSLCIMGHFCVNIFLDTPLSVCKDRDTEGIYLLAENGKLKNIPGVDELYENPDEFDLILKGLNLDENIEIIIEHIKEHI